MPQNHNIKVPLEALSKRIGGSFTITVHHPDGTEESRKTDNLIVDAGIKRLGDILAGILATNIELEYMEPDAGTTNPAAGDTDSESALTPADRLAATVQSRAAGTPYEVVIETFISSTKYTRPQTINKLNLFFGPDETGDLFAAGKLTSPITLNTDDTATITYGIVFK